MIIRILAALAATLGLCANTAFSQTPVLTDGLMMPRRQLGTGVFYGYDVWDRYWEGSLKRENGNVGTVTTQSVVWMGAYGLSKRVTLLSMLPYLWTKSSSGTLRGQNGVQDLTLGAKYNFASAVIGKNEFQFFGLLALSFPASNYSKDFLPLSIGLGSKNISYRVSGSYTYNEKWYAVASAAYTWRSNVFLDRPSYYTDGQFFFTNEVRMPNLFDYIVRVGYQEKMWQAELFITQQETLGGGDIRRQDMPFVSNRMNFTKAGVSLRYQPPFITNLALRTWGSYTVTGRNVGQSFSLMIGGVYSLAFKERRNLN